MMCPHCMQDSKPTDPHMSDETFEKVLGFCEKASPLLVSVTGGEPTEHPQWHNFVKQLLQLPSRPLVSILTNGQWIEDKTTRLAMAALIRENKGRVMVQVYSNPKYYKDHEWTVSHKSQFKSIGCITEFDSPIVAMQDLGRARKNCQEEIAGSDHMPSCINSFMIAWQSRSFSEFLMKAVQVGKFCRPLIAVDGYIHMSESALCPPVAHIDDGPDGAFSKMRDAAPCGSCRLFENFADAMKLKDKLSIYKQ